MLEPDILPETTDVVCETDRHCGVEWTAGISELAGRGSRDFIGSVANLFSGPGFISNLLE